MLWTFSTSHLRVQIVKCGTCMSKLHYTWPLICISLNVPILKRKKKLIMKRIIQIKRTNFTGLRIPTGCRQTRWLFTSVVGDLNSRPSRTNPAACRSWGGTWTRNFHFANSRALTAKPRWLFILNVPTSAWSCSQNFYFFPVNDMRKWCSHYIIFQPLVQTLFQFLPIILLVLLSVMSSFLLQDPPYSLSRTG